MADTDFTPEEEMTTEEQEQIKADEEFLLGVQDEDFEDAETAEKIREAHARVKTTIHQKRHYRTTTQTLRKENEDLKKGDVKVEKPAENNAATTKEDSSTLVAIEFRQDHPELPKSVAKEVIEYARALNITPEEAMKRPVMANMIKTEQNREDVEEASVTSGQRSGGSHGQKDWSTATQAEVIAQRNKNLGQG